MFTAGWPVSCAFSAAPSRVTLNIWPCWNLKLPTYRSSVLAGSWISLCSTWPGGAAVGAGVSAFGGLTCAASAVRATETDASVAAPRRRHLTGLLIMCSILSSRNVLDSDIAATAPIYAD
jgi:hypothetical protein